MRILNYKTVNTPYDRFSSNGEKNAFIANVISTFTSSAGQMSPYVVNVQAKFTSSAGQGSPFIITSTGRMYTSGNQKPFLLDVTRRVGGRSDDYYDTYYDIYEDLEIIGLDEAITYGGKY
jgi:hypothetical protein